MGLASLTKAGQILRAATDAVAEKDQQQEMFRPTSRLGPAVYVILFMVSTGVLTLGLAAIGLVVAPGSADLIESFYAQYIYRGTVEEVDACVDRYADTVGPDALIAFCRGRYSRTLQGSRLVAEGLCMAPDGLTVTVRNMARGKAVTGFTLQTRSAKPTIVRGDWIIPGESRTYYLEATCDPAEPVAVTAVAQVGLQVDMHLAMSATEGVDRFETSSEMAVVAQPRASEVEEVASLQRDVVALEKPDLSNPAELAEPLPAAGAIAAAIPEPRTEPVPEEQRDRVESERRSVSLPYDRIRIRESDGGALIPVNIAPAADSAAWIEYRVIPATARSSQDFAGSLQGRVRVQAGEDEAAVMVPMVNDSLAESDESFTVRLAAVSDNLYLPERTEAQVQIVDDD